MIYKRIFFLVLVSLFCLSVRAQTAANIQGIISSVDTLRSRMPAEKLYIQFDKPYYNIGDTVWMKAYLYDDIFLHGSQKSGIVYLELANDSNKVFWRKMLPLGFGLGTGYIVLDKDNIPEGSYTIRAYSNLMRNFGEDLVFKKDFYISGSSTIRNWLVDSKIMLSKQSGKDHLRLGFRFRQFNQEALRMHDLDIRVLEERKVLFRDRVKTDPDGILDINFELPEKADAKGSPFGAKNISLMVNDPGATIKKVIIPIPINRPENIDLQFMPEGGNLVNGIASKVGFKAIGEDGKGTEVSGKIYKNNTQEVAAFSSSYKGIGSFELTPKEGESYTAKVTQNGVTKDFPLPAVKSAGTVLRINNSHNSDSIEVTILSSLLPAAYYLVAQSRGIVCYGAIIRFSGSPVSERKIAKSLFATGIVRFTLMSTDRQALNERIAYIDHHDQLNITVQADKGSYQKRDSISLAIEVRDHEDKPVEGSFSMTVTDDSQVSKDSLNANILTSLLLTSGLKGIVEDPGHYLEETEQAWGDLDHLLLTQGWIGYDWKDVFNPPLPQYQAEPEFMVRGRVSNVLNKGLPGTGIQLLSSKPSFVMTGLTAKDGSFSFAGFPVAADLSLFIQARNKNGKTSNVGIEVSEFKAPVFLPSKQRFMPWYVNSDTTLLRQISTKAVQVEKISANGTNLLEEVVITEKKAVRDSKNLNGPGESDQTLDEKDLALTPKKTLLNLMQEKVPGFNKGIWPGRSVAAAGIEMEGMGGQLMGGGAPPGVSFGAGNIDGVLETPNKGTVAMEFAPVMSYVIYDKEMHLIIDGVDVESFYIPTRGNPYPTTKPRLIMQKNLNPAGDYILERNTASPYERLEFIKQFLDGILAEDIKGIEVMYNPKYNSRYKMQYAARYLSSLSMISTDITFVEVTTYSGNGSYLKKTPGTYLYKPLPFVGYKTFYRPKYIVKNSVLSDLRSTIHWEPDILTDKNGKAVVSFYSSDKPGTYSFIMEGSDMNGTIGRQTGTVRIRE